MPYKKIKTLCLSPDVTYKEAKKVIEPIFDEWWDKRFEEQMVDATELMEVLLAVAQNKSRISNYTLGEFLHVIAGWGYKIYWQEEKWEEAKVEAKKEELIVFIKEMLQTIKRSKTKTSDRLRSYLLRFISGMLGMELKPAFLPILEESMMVMDTDEQFFALDAMSSYFSWEGTKLSKELIDKLDKIVATTTIRSNASNALDVQINAGIIDRLNAVFAMDNWKDRNRENW